MVDLPLLFLTVLMLLLSAFFSGTEIAFISANRLKIELKSKQGDRIGDILSKFVKNTPRVLTTILVGNNLALVIYGIGIGKLLQAPLADLFNLTMVSGEAIGGQDSIILLVAQTIISTLIILFFGEYFPKAIYRINADQRINSSAWLLNVFYNLFYVFVISINAVSRWFITKVLRLHFEERELEFSKQDLDLYVKEVASDNEGATVHEIDTEMFSNALDFNEIRAKECMVPRTEIEAMDIDEDIGKLLEKLIETEHSRIIIYKENLDEVLGYVHSSSMFQGPKKISDILQPLLMIPESMPANVLLSEFTKSRKGVAIVVDEFGGTEGMVTIEDLVEEVFGEIVDEYDEEEETDLIEKQLDENNWLFSARLEVDDINKAHELTLPEGDYNTLGGLVMFYAEAIPKANETVELPGYKIIILDASENKVNTVKISREIEE